jgi:lipopolysaccharide transport system ATP-binding protein
MSQPIIRIDGLCKRYRIGAIEKRRQLRESIVNAVSAPGRWLRAAYHPGASNDVIWALKDVEFEVAEGEVVGIIGRNGAGKSTLLKILSRITDPTEGRVTLTGRVGSLLEVGTGFHPELTGRENIYLNGVILGMKRAEIRRKFDEIVAFAEIEEFLDTPVKRYSSGMYMRLAFAVAAHLESDILLVDEVLAVGDAAFQAKCLGKMESVARQGRTVLFVSHNMSSVQHLCRRAILFRGGRLEMAGEPAQVIGHYLSDACQNSAMDIRNWHDRNTTGEGQLTRLEITDRKGRGTTSVPLGGTVSFTFHAEFHRPVVDPCFNLAVYNAMGEPILDLSSSHDGMRLGRVVGPVRVRVSVEKLGLYPGRYLLSPCITDSLFTHEIDHVKLCCTLDVLPAPGPHGDLTLNPAHGRYWIPSSWSAAGAGESDMPPPTSAVAAVTD